MRSHVSFFRRSARAPSAHTSRLSLAGPILTGLLSLIGGLFGGVLGNALLDATKSADSLRRFALTESFRPLRDQTANCAQKRTALIGQLKSAELMFGIARAALDSVDLSNPPGTDAISSIETWTKRTGEILEKTTLLHAEVNHCARAIVTRVDEISILLGLTRRTDGLRGKHMSQLNSRTKDIGGSTPKLDEYFSDGDKLTNLIRAAAEGASGNVSRANAAFARLKAIVAEFHQMFAAEGKRHAFILESEQAFSGDFSALVLTDLHSKFSRSYREMLFDAW